MQFHSRKLNTNKFFSFYRENIFMGDCILLSAIYENNLRCDVHPRYYRMIKIKMNIFIKSIYSLIKDIFPSKNDMQKPLSEYIIFYLYSSLKHISFLTTFLNNSNNKYFHKLEFWINMCALLNLSISTLFPPII